MKLLGNYKPRWVNIARILFFAAAFLWVAGKFIPQMPENIPLESITKNTPVIPMLTTVEDRRGVREDIPLSPSLTKKRIAWITDSSGIIIPKEKDWDNTKEHEVNLDALYVAKKLRAQNYEILMYSRVGTCPTTIFINTLSAVRFKPDLAVISVNPIMRFNRYKVLNHREYLNRAPALWAQNYHLWPYIFLFTSPSQNLWAAASFYLNIIHESYRFKNFLENEITSIMPNLAPAQVKQQLDTQETVQKNTWLWLHTLSEQERNDLHDSPQQILGMYKRLIRQSFPETGSRGGYGIDTLEQMIDVLEANKIPAIIFLSPISADYYTDATARRKLDEIKDYLDNIHLEDPKLITIISEVPKSVRDTIDFRNDGYHMNDIGNFDKYLSKQIERKMND